MEFLAGESLSEAIDAGPMAPARALAIHRGRSCAGWSTRTPPASFTAISSPRTSCWSSATGSATS